MNKNRELTQHRTELQRIRQAITEISSELHPDDTRQLIQKLNLLEIQWTDAERSLTVLIDSLTKRRSEYQDFENKFLRFIQWFENFLNNEINQRLNGLTIQTSLEILKNDIRNIITDKRKYANELLIQARLLQSQLTDQIQIEIIKQKIEQLEHIMDTIEQHVEKRIKKTEITCKMFNEFEQGCENIRLWMDTIETNLQRTLPTQNTNEFHIHQQSIAAIEMDIEKHSTVMSSLLALGHNLLNDTDISSRTIDSLSRRIQTLEQRWLSLNELIKKNENSNNIHISWRNIDETINRVSKMIYDHERFLTEIKRTSGDGLQGVRNEYESLEDDKEIQQIENYYSEILRLHPTADSNNEIRNRIKDLNHRWKILNETVHETCINN
ncbi:unnamed protein product [Rotaria sordida]|uniref:Uncharacterized protein n=1 Tax=Rotaria sordida TaxID=392033 RepID=A0A815AU29_9BILA|nr:unnamed protein product [Rotaria sordida]